MIKVWKEGSDLQLPTEEASGFNVRANYNIQLAMITPPNLLRQIAQCNLSDIADSLRHTHSAPHV